MVIIQMRQETVTPMIYIFRMTGNTKYIHTYMYHELCNSTKTICREVYALKVISMTGMMSPTKNIIGKTIPSAMKS